MASENENNHITPYRTFLLVLAGLGTLTVAVALIIAAIKSSFVLRIFMHLKTESRFFSFAVMGVVSLFSAVLIITLIDYITR